MRLRGYKQSNLPAWVRQGFAKYQSVKNDNEQPDYIIDTIGDIVDVIA